MLKTTHRTPLNCKKEWGEVWELDPKPQISTAEAELGYPEQDQRGCISVDSLPGTVCHYDLGDKPDNVHAGISLSFLRPACQSTIISIQSSVIFTTAVVYQDQFCQIIL